MLNLGGIEVVSTGETHDSHQEKVTSLQISFQKKSGPPVEAWEGKNVTLTMAVYFLKRRFAEEQPDFD